MVRDPHPCCPLGARAAPLRSAPRAGTTRGSFNSALAGCGKQGCVLPPPPIRVSGEWVTEGGGRHTTPTLPRPPLPPCFLRRRRQEPKARARAPRSPSGTQQVGLSGLARRLLAPSPRWCACPGAGPVVGRRGRRGRRERRGRRRPQPSPWLRAGGRRGVRCARQVSALTGSVGPRWVGPRCGKWVSVGRGVRGAREPPGSPWGDRGASVRGGAGGGRSALVSVAVSSPGWDSWEPERRGSAERAAPANLGGCLPGQGAAWSRRSSFIPRRRLKLAVPQRRGQLFTFMRQDIPEQRRSCISSGAAVLGGGPHGEGSCAQLGVPQLGVLSLRLQRGTACLSEPLRSRGEFHRTSAPTPPHPTPLGILGRRGLESVCEIFRESRCGPHWLLRIHLLGVV